MRGGENFPAANENAATIQIPSPDSIENGGKFPNATALPDGHRKQKIHRNFGASARKPRQRQRPEPWGRAKRNDAAARPQNRNKLMRASLSSKDGPNGATGAKTENPAERLASPRAFSSRWVGKFGAGLGKENRGAGPPFLFLKEWHRPQKRRQRISPGPPLFPNLPPTNWLKKMVGVGGRSGVLGVLFAEKNAVFKARRGPRPKPKHPQPSPFFLLQKKRLPAEISKNTSFRETGKKTHQRRHATHYGVLPLEARWDHKDAGEDRPSGIMGGGGALCSNFSMFCGFRLVNSYGPTHPRHSFSRNQKLWLFQKIRPHNAEEGGVSQKWAGGQSPAAGRKGKRR